ncbi:MAG TPA: glucose-6-phosphate isomerase [Steroidobacteraceae bacterium]|nr:glucose-6-phosphate isomerase [Steroidobacteraceae bacterium]
MTSPTLPFASPDLAARLAAHAARLRATPVRELAAADPGRYGRLSLEAEGILLDFSRQVLDSAALLALVELAEAAGLGAAVERLYGGAIVNPTEGRPALHVALRDRSGTPLAVGGTDVRALVARERQRCRDFVRAVATGARVGATGRRFTDVVNIGIGGSDLGPVMAVEALRGYAHTGLDVHFVSNLDGVQFADLAGRLEAATTLVLICSKTFTTLETLTNARLVRHWVAERLGEPAVPQHFAAVSVNHPAMDAFGIAPDARFTMWDWVGGRYSMWSAIGLAIELAIGSEHFESLLDGAYAIDAHFRTAPLSRNLPALLGLLGVWNRHYLACGSLAVLPYDQRLHRFPAYLQQLSMESNGKRVRRDGEPVRWSTEPVIWGEPGSNGQHSFFQLLHQGTSPIALDFLLPAQSSVGLPESQNLAAANCLAQAEAFAYGYTLEEATAELLAKGTPAPRAAELAPHKVHPGNRPASVIAFQRLDPATLGKLVALYEHKVYVESVLWDINPFDQWGVELGKRLAEQLAPAVRGERPLDGQPGLQALIDRLATWRSA